MVKAERRTGSAAGRLLGWVFCASLMLLSPALGAVDPLLLPRVAQELAKGNDAVAFALLEEAIRDPATPPEARADLLAELAAERARKGDFADAGEALALQAEQTSRLEGPTAPDLAGIYAAAADAYLRAGKPELAIGLAREALRVDQIYADCASGVLGRDHGRLAELLAALGRAGEAQAEAKLAADAEARCREAGGDSGPRGVEVTTDATPAGPDSFASVKVFYATDRARTGDDRPNDFYGGERGTVEYGILDVTVPRIHKAGEVESPSFIRLEWSENQERHFVISRLTTATAAEMFEAMRTTLRENRSDEVFVFVHGFNTSFADAAKRTAQIAYDLNFTGAPVLYSWPSAATTFAYISDEAVVRLSGRHLRRFLEDLVAQSGARTVNLIAHSMGNRALIDALELLAAQRIGAAIAEPLFSQVIFAAPDEDSGLFFEMIKSVRSVARRLTLYGSDTDVALFASRQVHGAQPRAGEGASSMVISEGLDSIDMSVLGDDMLGHGYFASSSSALTDMVLLFWRDTAPDARCGMDQRDAENGRFWQFNPERCDGAAMLSALSLLKSDGDGTLAKVDAILAEIAANPDRQREAKEWTAIRQVVAELTGG